MDFSKTIFRCSSLGHLMTEPRAKKDKDAGNLSESAKTHLIDVYVQNKYGRRTDINSRYIEKGLMVEEDSITLYSRVTKTFFKKNEEHLINDFIKGTPDLYTGKSIQSADTIIDIKSSWDLFTFFRNHTKEVNDIYYWQLQGYMYLTGAKISTLAYCLVSTPEVLINDEKRKLLWKMGVTTEMNEDYLKACDELEKSMIYDDISMKERVIEFEVTQDETAIDLIQHKIRKGREFLNELDQRISPSFLLAEGDKELNTTLITEELTK